MRGRWLTGASLAGLVTLLAGSAAVEAGDRASSSASPTREAVFAPPDPAAMPDTGDYDVIRSGYEMVVDTQNHARSYIGNGLNCTNCHLDAGRRLGAAPFVGLTALFPEYRSRNDRMNRLEDRLNDCFERSMNGRPLPQGSPEQAALVAYITWLSQGVSKEAARAWRGFPKIASTRRPDPRKGQALFAERCAACHAENGQGSSTAPPLWGPRSYNLATGMARVSLAASFIKANMPLGQGGTLTDEEAYDLAAFINGQPRPDFAGKANDWPRGGRPDDLPY